MTSNLARTTLLCLLLLSPDLPVSAIPLFDMKPPPKKGDKVQGSSTSEGGKPPWLKIGFIQIRKRVMMDTEESHIATPALIESFVTMRDNKRPELAHGFLPQSGSTQRYSGVSLLAIRSGF
ncbi:hypothetical protein EDB85DRAFT_2277628 [Lactarius pseudohatsudake]|nr:hypothetical protein EDB85DRAFT_2277628 [Lactarius pseudohatsudake]